MKKVFLILVLWVIGFLLFAQATDEQIRQSATVLGVPYNDLKQFVESYKEQQTIPIAAVRISSVNLSREYNSNELKSDSQYKGKTMTNPAAEQRGIVVL